MRDLVGRLAYKNRGFYEGVIGTVTKSPHGGGGNYYLQMPNGRVAILSEQDITLVDNKRGDSVGNTNK